MNAEAHGTCVFPLPPGCVREDIGLVAMDLGSVSLWAAFFDREGSYMGSSGSAHSGRVGEWIQALRDLAGAGAIMVGTDEAGEWGRGMPLYDSSLCLIQAARTAEPGLGSILHVGAERFFLIRFGKDGTYRDILTNSSCAAGTGGFLDQQARRLSLSGSAELGELALAAMQDPASPPAPRIASRCSVFAKTDLIHAQQEGHGLAAICEGLCRGLAATICDTVFSQPPPMPLLISGGVALNRGVVKAMEERLGQSIIVPPEAARLPAIGAGLLALADLRAGISLERRVRAVAARIPPAGQGGQEGFETISPPRSDYPEFGGLESYAFVPGVGGAGLIVECTRYAPIGPGEAECWFGLDIGSTSTKAVLTDARGSPLAGFYTRTSGRPLEATRALMEAAEAMAAAQHTRWKPLGAASTGSGRAFIGAVIGADLILDEISAHAAAAAALDPEVDTIIEIGGQDAKFTTLRGGDVIFSRMNAVCAAGTGSFIEEQAQKLGVGLEEYAALALGARAPQASDRCTVFMERDINYYLSRGYSKAEILAAVLCSVRENYLLKVADESAIGRRICFQGATARNRALVAAFEGRLGQAIRVSPYCHLAGALGAALTLMREERPGPSAFRGLGLWRTDIPQTTETCELCRNHCRIRVLSVDGQRLSFGHLCGREEGRPGAATRAQEKPGQELLERRRAIIEALPGVPRRMSVGIPTALQGLEELDFWQDFFGGLGIQTLNSASLSDPVSRGKKVSGAEFCAPLTAFHGHLAYLAERADYIFLPVYLERRESGHRDRKRNYCYYTQFSSALARPLLEGLGKGERAISPLFADRCDSQAAKAELWRALKPAFGEILNQAMVNQAYDTALSRQAAHREALKSGFHRPDPPDFAAVLLGRPYTVLAASMNSGIPRVFADLGVELYYQDMLPDRDLDLHPDAEFERLMDRLHWVYAADILRAARYCALTEGLYPVLVSSFKCAPDSFIQEYLARVMEGAGKPYLVLQLDQHSSNVGYATRIEAALRSFRNHARAAAVGAARGSGGLGKTGEHAPASRGGGVVRARPALPIASEFVADLRGKTVFLPAWDPVSVRLLAASMRNQGYDAHMLEETPETVAEGLKTNSGQCVPVNIIAHEYAREIERRSLDPARTVLWMISCSWACNIGMYPAYIKSLLERRGGGLERAGVYSGDLTMIELGPMMTARAYFSFLLGGALQRLSCRVRPYETIRGMSDAAARRSLALFEHACREGRGLKEAARRAVALFEAVPRDESRGRRPKVAIFGDMYLRDNPVMNQDLIRCIEEQGGEVLVLPYTEYTKIASAAHFKKWLRALELPKFALFRAMLAALEVLEGGYAKIFGELAGPRLPYRPDDVAGLLAPFGVRLEQEGETYDNLLKVRRLAEAYPDLALFVHTSPAFCCPSLVTQALAGKIEEVSGVPVVNIIYDGTMAPRNGILAPYLAYPRQRALIDPLSPDARGHEPGIPVRNAPQP